MQVALKAYGERGILACGLSDAERRGLASSLQIAKPDHCLEYVEGFNTILFIFKQAVSVKDLSAWLAGIDAMKHTEIEIAVHDVPVVYDGPDLEYVAEQTGLSVEEVIRLHSAPVYRVRMIGFAPGFPYLDGLDPRLHLSRKDIPRTRIEPGTVAIGGSHAGIYSVASPGGWHLLGRTNFPLFNLEAAAECEPDPGQIFTVSPGDQLKFIPIA